MGYTLLCNSASTSETRTGVRVENAYQQFDSNQARSTHLFNTFTFIPTIIHFEFHYYGTANAEPNNELYPISCHPNFSKTENLVFTSYKGWHEIVFNPNDFSISFRIIADIASNQISVYSITYIAL